MNALPYVCDITPYQPGKPIEALLREYGLEKAVKLASNENPLGSSANAIKAIQNTANEIHRYPDGAGFYLKKALAAKYNVDAEMITLGNGSNDILELIAHAYLAPNRAAMFSQHAFAVYPLATQAVGAIAQVIPALNYSHDLDKFLETITDQTTVIFIANPNNPTGTWFDKTAWEHFIAKVPENILVVLDEAYFEYVNEDGFFSGIDYLEKYPNLIISRTFSKIYGLAGLRIGYSISSTHIADILNRIRQPFNTNILAQSAAIAALEDDEFVQKSIAINQQGMLYLRTSLAKLGFNALPSVGNFLCVNFGKDTMAIYQALLKQGVIVRPVANYQLPEYLRVSIGLEEENTFFIEKLTTIINATI